MASFEEIRAALNAPGVVTSTPLSFNQLKIEIANRLHIEADDAVFTENKQVLKDAYVEVYRAREAVAQRLLTESADLIPKFADSRLSPSKPPVLLPVTASL